MYFLPAKIKKDLNFLRCIHVFDLVLKFCADINERNWLQVLIWLLCVGWNWWLGYWNEFIFSVFLLLEQNFLLLFFYGNVCNWFPKVIWPRLVHFCSLLLEYVSFGRLHICMDWNLKEVLKLVSPLLKKFFKRLVWGVLWSVLQKCPYFSDIELPYIDWSALSLQCKFTSYVFCVF